ncbi:hypothetical protein CHLRE_10g423050v5 [Chlamydomonas reinhardtii]|uniref:Reverse transcriptase/retrotransposon-derived protein RNase H-like domain-containing protein n=1 Tax=Chlamydomonas reinhardtii TaxID=3055 RepID=A0A2K3D9B7_CHLRE|nr:uncharacterized protein CHLRE_10g423050v5 [Chlamydomonas reinhardtii]PNW77124.1 hypothetical protein CHLRE_10g423050v5 [Chlamydomonas reinhardtii]
MFYYSTRVLSIGGAFPLALRDPCADVNLISEDCALQHGFQFKPSKCNLTTGTQQSGSVKGQLVTEGVTVTLLAGTGNEVRLPLTKTLVVPSTKLFGFLAGNEQFHALADYITQYPIAQLHFYPNVVQQPQCVVTVPMARAADARAVCAIRDAAIAEDAASDCSGSVALCSHARCASANQPASSPASEPDSAAELGGDCSAKGSDAPSTSDKTTSQGGTADAADSVGSSAENQRSWGQWLAEKATAASQAGASALIRCMDTKHTVTQEKVRKPRHGKRKRAGVRYELRTSVSVGRTWSGLLTFLLFATTLLATVTGVGATRGRVGGQFGAEVSQHALNTGAYLLHAASAADPSFAYHSDIRDWQTRNHSAAGGPQGIAHALATVDAYGFDGKRIATAHERYAKDPEGGWIWGNSSALSPVQTEQLKQVVRARKDTAFAYSMNDLPGYKGNAGDFRIELDTDKPIIQPPRRYSPQEQKIIKEKTQELVDAGIVVEWTGPTVCAVNPVIAAKKDPDTGLWTGARMAQDYRPVNSHTKHDKYGLHRPEDIFQRTKGAKVFSHLDCRQGFLQVPLAEEDQLKTAFWCGNRLMMYKRMPYGLKNASAAFQRRVDYELTRAGLDHCAAGFIEDIVIWSKTPEEHAAHVAAVLACLAECGLRAHPDKSIFGAEVIEYLGHNLSEHGISPSLAKVEALQPPKNVSELRTQLGFINYYRCYIPNMSLIARDLTELLKTGAPWVWGPRQQAAHDAIKAVFTQEGLVLRPIDYSRQLILHTDFSNRGIAAVLGQLDDDGNEYMCACISRSLNKHEVNYSSYKGEMLASTTSSSPSCRAAPALAIFAEHHDFTPWSLRDLALVARLLAGRPRLHGFAMLLAGRSLLPGSQWRGAERLFR